MAINIQKMELTDLVDYAHRVQGDMVKHKDFAANLPILRGAILDHYIRVVYELEERHFPVNPLLDWLDNY